MEKFKNKKVILGVTGGVAAYKAADFCSKLVKADAEVHVIMTKNALEFVGKATFEALTHNPVRTSLFNEKDDFYPHLNASNKADIVIVMPATANIIGKAANGLADDLLSTILISVSCPVILCPAMNHRMWINPVVQINTSRLKEFGFHFIYPEKGNLACGEEGVGRLANIQTIFDECAKKIK